MKKIYQLSTFTVFLLLCSLPAIKGDNLKTQIYKKFKQAFPNLNEQQYLNAQIIINTAFAQTQVEQQIVYFLATAYGAARMFPVRERLAKVGSKTRKYQMKYWDTGFFGRGYVQITWQKVYQQFKGILGIDLVSHPDLVLNPFIAAEIMIVGMRRGIFSSGGNAKLGDFLGEGKFDFYNARKTVYALVDAEYYQSIAVNILGQKIN